MKLTAETDAARRRVIITAPPGTRWSVFQTFVREQVVGCPDLAEWNWIIDDQGPMDDADVAGMAATGAIFRLLAAEPSRPSFTVVVSTDPYFENWAKVIDLNYGVRKHYAAPTRIAAEALLDRLEMTARPNGD